VDFSLKRRFRLEMQETREMCRFWLKYAETRVWCEQGVGGGPLAGRRFWLEKKGICVDLGWKYRKYAKSVFLSKYMYLSVDLT